MSGSNLGLIDRTSLVRRLVNELSGSLSAGVKDTVGRLELTQSQASLLRDLNEPKTQRELARSLLCEPSNVTFVVDRLEERGLVTREPNPRDRRSKIVRLTTIGRQTREQMIRSLEEQIPLARLSDQELGLLESLLRKALEPAAPR